MKRTEPAWVVAFLNALERTGTARQAAADVGVDWSTAYARRRVHEEFAARWAEALRRHEERAKAEEASELAGFTPPPTPSPDRLGEDLVVANGQVKRASTERWGKRRRNAYLAELAATGNHRLAAKAAGLSYEAVLRRRKMNPSLEQACQAAIAACQARAPEFLATAMVATFDPESMPYDGINPLPKMSIGEAIKISQMSARAHGPAPNPFEEQAASMNPEEVDALRQRLLRKLSRLEARRKAEQLSEGWLLDEEHDLLVPPGWVRSAPPADDR
jgi:molybdenum-dependent DNA-binding transcriptional regulator ModE